MNKEETGYQVFYRCPECGHDWDEVWSCACDSECPECGQGDIMAYSWIEDIDSVHVTLTVRAMKYLLNLALEAESHKDDGPEVMEAIFALQAARAELIEAVEADRPGHPSDMIEGEDSDG